jgi:hypothetical protein
VVFVCGMAMAAAAILYAWRMAAINRQYEHPDAKEAAISLRKFPYPYRAGLSISSDIDWTDSVEKFRQIQDYLSSTRSTPMGKGLGLDVASSFLFWENPDKTIHYFMSDEVRDMILEYIRMGQIDALHSFGKKDDFQRTDAIRALNELRSRGIHLDVWIDHTTSADNFGDDVTLGYGDHADRKEYHADITIDYGIKFVWMGRLSMIAGQACPLTLRSFADIYDRDHVFASITNIAKEFSKHILGLLGSKKYKMHGNNDLLQLTALDDGRNVYEFMRFDDYWQGVSTGADGKRLSYLISPVNLKRLIDRSGYMVVYTHLGNNVDCLSAICPETLAALKGLAQENENGNIYITSTSKLLRYYLLQKYLKWSGSCRGRQCDIHIVSVEDPLAGSYVPSIGQLEKITFYVPDKNQCRVFINQQEIPTIRKNDRDYTQRDSITIISR